MKAVCLAGLLLVAVPPPLAGQTVQVAPFGGYRFGGELFDLMTARSIDIDGAPAFGMTVDVFVDRYRGIAVSFLYSRQQATVAPDPWDATSRRETLAIDQWHLGGMQELDAGSVRPFLKGSAGLTRVSGGGDSEIRFSLAGGAGVTLLPVEHLGIRLEGRVYAIFVDGNFGSSICGGYGCFIGVDVWCSWQAETTAALVVSF